MGGNPNVRENYNGCVPANVRCIGQGADTTVKKRDVY